MSGERSLPSEACLHVNDLILMRITVKYESVIKGSWDEKKPPVPGPCHICSNI